MDTTISPLLGSYPHKAIAPRSKPLAHLLGAIAIYIRTAYGEKLYEESIGIWVRVQSYIGMAKKTI